MTILFHCLRHWWRFLRWIQKVAQTGFCLIAQNYHMVPNTHTFLKCFHNYQKLFPCCTILYRLYRKWICDKLAYVGSMQTFGDIRNGCLVHRPPKQRTQTSDLENTDLEKTDLEYTDHENSDLDNSGVKHWPRIHRHRKHRPPIHRPPQLRPRIHRPI